MIATGFDVRVKIQQIVQNQIPEFLLSESPKAADFLKQYYISQEYQGGPIDIAENLDQYLKVDNLTPEVISGTTKLKNTLTSSTGTIVVDSTKGFPDQYGLLKIDNEIITYTGITTNSFTGCIRGFSGITSYRQVNNPEELVFSTSSAGIHTSGVEVKNLSSLFLQEFYNKIKYTFVPGLENTSLTSNLDVSNFIKEAKSLYQSKGTEESFKILFRVLYNEDVKVIDLEQLLTKPSSAKFSRRENIIAERISGDPLKLVGQTIKKSTDERTQGSVSEVEIITRNNKTYYKISLFVGYNDNDLTEGTFTIPGNTKVLETVSVGSSIIPVDSTIGFGQTGVLISGSNKISYSDKSVNQFFGCSGVNSVINTASAIRSDEVAFGYEDGDPTKKVEVRITGVLSEFVPVGDISLASEGEYIGIRNVGESIKNPSENRTYKETFANSWIYNTSSRYQVSAISGSTFTLLSDIDKSSLKVGDSIEVLVRGTQNVVVSNATVSVINNATKQIILNGLGTFTPSVSLDYDIRRKIKKSSSTGSSLEYGNDKLIANIQNVYSDQKYGYVASNSLPSYTITKNISDATISEASGSRLQGFNSTTLNYSIISFTSNVPFITGDEVIYRPEKEPMPGLVSGNSYFVEVQTSKNQIKLYTSRSFIGTAEYLEFGSLSSGSGFHKFILARHRDLVISPQKLLRKFPLDINLARGKSEKTVPGGVGLLINGVEIVSPKTNDKIYYGPLESINVVNFGSGYDVLNPPYVEVDSPTTGTRALVRPVVSGSVESVLVDPQDFDISTVVSATIKGGNGTGAVLQPVISKRYREIEFDARESIYGGGIDATNETITFTTNHNFANGQSIIYSNNGNQSLGIGTFGPPDNVFNRIGNKTLVNGSEYYVQIVNPSSIKLYQTFSDYYVGVNTVGFTTENTTGIHKFRTLEKNTLREIKVIEPGNGYQSRNLYVKPTGISSERDCVVFKNHNFNDGDIVEYNISSIDGVTSPSVISGLSTANSYYVLKIDDDSFRLANAGIGASISSNYERKNYVKFSSTGTGYQIFKYPNIEINVNVSFGSTVVGVITATPVIRGQLIDAYLYEKGTGYGSNILNFVKKPKIRIKNGKNAEVEPIVKNGKIIQVQVLSSGSEYYSLPNLKIIGDGFGAVLRPVISNQKLVSVIVINPGTNYKQETTKINVVAAGSGAIIDPFIRSLTLNEQYRNSEDTLIDTQNNLQYSIVGYSTNTVASDFGDTGSLHSPIIGWAYDGNPIYGPYGFSDPESISSSVRLLRSGYVLDSSRVENRPTSFDAGFFIEDYVYTNAGDLDIHNGRFCKTIEFPNGTYAYFVGIATDTITNTLKPAYPYFIGDSYRSVVDTDNFILNQTFDFNNSDLIRNTFPYKVGDRYADNDFLVESNEIVTQQTLIESVTKGSVTSISIDEPGDGYRVGEISIFDDSNTGGNGLSLEISEVEGKTITNVSTSVETYNNSVFVWKDKETVEAVISPFHTISDNEYVSISGLSTSIYKLDRTHKVGVTTARVNLVRDISAVAAPGTVEDIFISNIPSTVSVGSTITIGIGGSETLRVLNVYNEGSILRVRRSDTGVAHTASSQVNVIPNKIEIPLKANYFYSTVNDIVYFNPKQSVGVGTTIGGSSTITNTVGGTSKNISILNRSIYLPNHPFKTGQQVTLVKKDGTSSFLCSVDGGVTVFNLPSSVSQTVYVINKSKDFIGITTAVGLTTNTEGVAFTTNGSDSYEYYITSNLTQVTGKVEKIKSTVSVSTSHGLQIGDIVTLNVSPNVTTGIGNSSSVRIKYNQEYDKVLVNPIGFNSTGINTSTSQITIDATNLKTGDKVFYNSTDLVASGLQTGTYFIYKIDDSTVKLSDTYYDTTLKYPNTISIVGAGGSRHEISLVNPQIPIVRNSDLVFNVSDSSLQNRKLKIFYDQNFDDEFVSVGNTSIFNISGVGTIGVTTSATFTLKYSDGIPSKLYYTLEKSGYLSTSDTEVRNHSEISFVDSTYNGTYTVTGVGTTSFNIALSKAPERNTLYPSQHDVLKYSTSSKTTSGGISKLKTIFAGYNYKKVPKFVGFSSSSGENANIVANSTTIGKINKTRILNAGFEYSSDKTIRPESYVSPIIFTEKSNTISNVLVTDGGKNYSSAPNLIIVDPETGEVVDNTSLSCTISGSSVNSVKIISNPYGLSSVQQRIVAIDNSNGVSISSITSSPAGIVTCVLSTPILGFTTNIFSVGEEIFVEGIEKDGTVGNGFNSADYGYQFFRVSSYTNTNPAVVEFNLSGIATNAGFAKTNQGYASIISRNNYPVFDITQTFATLNTGERLLTNIGGGYIERDLYVSESTRNYIKVNGSYTLSVGEKIKGKNSGVIVTVKSITENRGQFKVDYATRQDYGWISDTGKLNESYQVTSDNDYYQNLSYSVRSKIQYDEMIDPVNRLLHTSGLKNFADTQIESKVGSKVSYASTTNDTIVLDIIDDKRVDAINNFDLTLDIDTASNQTKSKFLKFKNKKLTDYIKCLTNRVLLIDDIESRFSNRESNSDTFVDIDFLDDTYSRYLIQVINPNNLDRQIYELTLLKDTGNAYVLEKGSLSNTNISLGEISGKSDSEGQSIRFTPTDFYDTDYDIKMLKTRFNSSVNGIGTQSVGFVNLTGVNKSVGIGTTVTLLSFNKDNIQSLYANIQILNTVTEKMNYVELLLDHDGTDTYQADFYFDSSGAQGNSSNYMGTFDSTISAGIVSLTYYNAESNVVLVRSSIVGFGSTSTGIGTYRFLTSDQPEGSESSARYESSYTVSSGTTSVIGVSTGNVSSLKSLVRVSYGNTTAVHQVLMLQDSSNVHTVQYPFLSIGSTSGIGTFGGEINGSAAYLKFYPDPSISSNIQVQSFNEIIYFENDYDNTPQNLDYGTATSLVQLSAYDAINGNRANRLDFDIRYDGTPIYVKTFNPSSSSILNPVTGVFTLPNHFFSTGEELYYEPGSSFVGVGATGVGIGATANYVGVVTTVLPPKVYAIKVNDSQFKLSTKREYALAGISVTFTSSGTGNAHTLEMSKKLEKTIISLNGVVQKPLTFVPISYTVANNYGSVGLAATFFSLSGISSIKPKDIIKIDEEYMSVTGVGIGTTTTGPISGVGTFPLIQVTRAFVGSAATSHNNGALAQIYRGAYNIENNKIWFTEAPKGNPRQRRNQSNLPAPKTTFNGRVYLRNDYTTNVIYDDVSDQFTGIGQTYVVTVQGINTTGIQTGSGVLFLNDIFQTPTTTNNEGNNYRISTQSGISSVRFTGITSSNGQIIVSPGDVNQNQLPRGGIIVSLGSTSGAGFAPLVGASVTAIVSGGVITAVGIGSTDIVGSGYRGVVSIGVTETGHIGTAANITATVGAGGTLTFNVVSGGTGYTNPRILVSEPNYENLPVIGVSRAGVGTTTDTGSNLLVTLDVGAISTTGIGSTLFEVSSFKISRPGYGFKVGDVFKPVGLVTAKGLSAPLQEFELTVLDTFTDSFSFWQFGELDYIDSIKNLQNNQRKRFPLYYNGQLLSFEKDPSNTTSVNIDLNAVLLIFINGVIQQPDVAYQFDGGTSFVFTDPPRVEDNVAIFFYRGTRGDDTVFVNVAETVKIGDSVQVFRNNDFDQTISQNVRVISNIPGSDKIETEIYTAQGIDETYYKPLTWIKQKVDKVINLDIVSKERDSLETQIYPTAKIIKDVQASDNSIFVDDATFFNYEENNYSISIDSVEGLIVQGTDPVSAAVTAVVSTAGTISSLSVVNFGSGYSGSATIKIASPSTIGVGVGSTATATVSIVGGSITTPVITNPGFGYTSSNPPQVIVSYPEIQVEKVTNITTVEGFAGIITGITTTTGTSGNPLALKLFVQGPSGFTGLATGHPILVKDTTVGTGLTSINNLDSSVIGIGTTNVDNIYIIANVVTAATNAEIIVNVKSDSNVSGVSTFGSSSSPVGRYSWGKLSGINRGTSPVAIGVSGLTVDVGLSTFPSIQRRGFGLRDTGALRKRSNV